MLHTSIKLTIVHSPCHLYHHPSHILPREHHRPSIGLLDHINLFFCWSDLSTDRNEMIDTDFLWPSSEKQPIGYILLLFMHYIYIFHCHSFLQNGPFVDGELYTIDVTTLDRASAPSAFKIVFKTDTEASGSVADLLITFCGEISK